MTTIPQTWGNFR